MSHCLNKPQGSSVGKGAGGGTGCRVRPVVALGDACKHLWGAGREVAGLCIISPQPVIHRHWLLKLKHLPGNISLPALWFSLSPQIWPKAGCFQYPTIPFCKPQIFREEPRTESVRSSIGFLPSVYFVPGTASVLEILWRTRGRVWSLRSCLHETHSG